MAGPIPQANSIMVAFNDVTRRDGDTCRHWALVKGTLREAHGSWSTLAGLVSPLIGVKPLRGRVKLWAMAVFLCNTTVTALAVKLAASMIQRRGRS